jgi:hypothetical protein
VARKPAKLPPGVRFLTAAELDERRARKAGRTLEAAEGEAIAGGLDVGALFGAVYRRARKARGRRRRIPRGIWRR